MPTTRYTINMRTQRNGAGVSRTRRTSWAAGALALLGTAACNPDKLLEVRDIDVATPESVTNVAALPALRNSAISDLQVALGAGQEDGVITMGALLGDEFMWAETFPTRFEIDYRTMDPQNGSLSTLYNRLQRSRAAADRAASFFEQLDPNNVQRAEVLAIAGLNYIYLAEQYCNGAPVSTFNVLTAEEIYGAPRTNAQLFEIAVAKFDTALRIVGTPATPTPAQTSTLNLARVGRGRALLNLGRFADAAAAVSGVPTEFRYTLFFSENTGRQNNPVFQVSNVFPRFSVGGSQEREGGNGLPYRVDGTTDPRVFVFRGTGGANPSVGADGSTPMWIQAKYPNRSAPVLLASGIEARLIEAENLQRTGGNYVQVLNTLRANLPTLLLTPPASINAFGAFNPPATAALPALTAPAGSAEQVDQLFKERAYWFFLDGHRLGDMRRLIRQYGRGSETVFPTGAHQKGGAYGPDVNFPIPFNETNNPEFAKAGGQCLDRRA
jgi:hypothetical protein